MKNIAYLLSILLLLGLTGCGTQDMEQPDTSKQETSQTSEGSTQSMEAENKNPMSDKDQILAVYNKLQQAMVNKDIDTLRDMMGANTTVRHISGRTQTMDEWLSDVENEEMKYYSIEVTDPQIRINGDAATLTCSNVIDARIYGSRGTWTLSGGANFEKINSEWVMSHPDE